MRTLLQAMLTGFGTKMAEKHVDKDNNCVTHLKELGLNKWQLEVSFLLFDPQNQKNQNVFLSAANIPYTPPYLTADAESLQWVEAEPTSVPCLFEAVHKFCVERPLQGRESHQEHVLLLGGQLVLQDIMTSPGMTMKVVIWLKKQKKKPGQV